MDNKKNNELEESPGSSSVENHEALKETCEVSGTRACVEQHKQQLELAKQDADNQETVVEVNNAPSNSGEINKVTDAVYVSELNTAEAIKETRNKHAKKAWETFIGKNIPSLLFYGEESKVIKMTEEEWGSPENWFLIGDIHGDYFALRNIVEYIILQHDDFKIIFLGDLIDRGSHAMDCLWYLLYLVQEYPHRIVWLAGNHDVGVFYNKETNSFGSRVKPSEFKDHLNVTDQWAPFRQEFGLEYIELVEGLPRALITPDGLLITHGGIPHLGNPEIKDSVKNWQTQEDVLAFLNGEIALNAFSWARIRNKPALFFNRAATASGFGANDFKLFCEKLKDFIPIEILVSGHNHHEEGFENFNESEYWKTSALTLNGFGFSESSYKDIRIYSQEYRSYLVVGRCRHKNKPEIINIPVNKEDLESFQQQEFSSKYN